MMTDNYQGEETKINIKSLLEMLIVYALAGVVVAWINLGLLGSLLIVGTIYTYYKLRTRSTWNRALIKGLAQALLVTIILYYLNHWLGAWGWIGLLLLCTLTALWLIYKQRVFFMHTLRSVERQLFGETAEERWARRRKE